MRCFCIAVCLLWMVGWPNPGCAQSRVALVIGNSDYRHTARLPNPANDASDIGAALRRLNFDVLTITNARYDDMRQAVISLTRKARGSEIAVVFFAGHGAEIAGENYLIPIDAQLATDLDVPNETISLQTITRAVSTSTKLGLVLLDACRNNPFLVKMQRTAGVVRAVDRGFARVEPTGNILVAYAAAAGTTAKDGTGRNSPFTASLLGNIETPGLEIGNLFRAVREDVMVATRNEQQPFVYGSLAKEFIYLKPAASGADARPTKPNPPVVATIPPAAGNASPAATSNSTTQNSGGQSQGAGAYSDLQLIEAYNRLCDGLKQGSTDEKYVAKSLLTCDRAFPSHDATRRADIRYIVAGVCSTVSIYCHGSHHQQLLGASRSLQCPATGKSCE